jgi:hypothetical protein
MPDDFGSCRSLLWDFETVVGMAKELKDTARGESALRVANQAGMP